MDDVQIETADIVSKFKFFETYKPSEKEKKAFRITPPRDGVAKVNLRKLLCDAIYDKFWHFFVLKINLSSIVASKLANWK